LQIATVAKARASEACKELHGGERRLQAWLISEGIAADAGALKLRQVVCVKHSISVREIAARLRAGSHQIELRRESADPCPLTRDLRYRNDYI